MPQTPNWQRLAKLITTVGYGEMRLVIQNGEPVRAELISKSIRLDNPDEFEVQVKLISL